MIMPKVRGGYHNFTETPGEGGMNFLGVLFPKSTTPPQQEILNSPLQDQIRVNDSQVDEFKWGIQVLNLTFTLRSISTWCCNVGLATSAIHLITMVSRA